MHLLACMTYTDTEAAALPFTHSRREGNSCTPTLQLYDCGCTRRACLMWHRTTLSPPSTMYDCHKSSPMQILLAGMAVCGILTAPYLTSHQRSRDKYGSMPSCTLRQTKRGRTPGIATSYGLAFRIASCLSSSRTWLSRRRPVRMPIIVIIAWGGLPCPLSKAAVLTLLSPPDMAHGVGRGCLLRPPTHGSETDLLVPLVLHAFAQCMACEARRSLDFHYTTCPSLNALADSNRRPRHRAYQANGILGRRGSSPCPGKDMRQVRVCKSHRN